MDNTIIQSGSFTSDGLAKILSIRSDVDWFKIRNYTNWATPAATQGVDFFWQRGFAENRALMTYYDGGTALLTAEGGLGALSLANSAGISLINDTNAPIISGSNTTATESTAVQPVIASGTTTGLQIGDTVRLSWTSGNKHAAFFYDFDIDAVNAGVSFTQAFELATLPTDTGGPGAWRKINRNSPWYPRKRSIIKVEAGTDPTTTRIHFSVAHDFTVGQQIRIHVPLQKNKTNIFGMTELDGLKGNILVANTPSFGVGGETSNWVEVDIDSSTFTAFTTPATSALSALVQLWPYVNPIGEDTPAALAAVPQANILGDATQNMGILGVSLNLGVTDALSPCGTSGDVMYWIAGKSFNQ